jgi:hypothetical protein
MGLLDDAIKKAGGAVKKAQEVADDVNEATGKKPTAGKKKPKWGPRDPDKADYGKAGAPTPDMDSLVTDAEIESITGAAPKDAPRKNGSDGSEVDLGRHVIREWKLENGDKFLISLGNCTDAAAAQLSMDRVAEVEKPLDGVGERGLLHVEKRKSGTSEVGVTALQDNFNLSLVHTSSEGKTDPEPLKQLLNKALKRL